MVPSAIRALEEEEAILIFLYRTRLIRAMRRTEVGAVAATTAKPAAILLRRLQDIRGIISKQTPFFTSSQTLI